jgi:hypothetical protein
MTTAQQLAKDELERAAAALKTFSDHNLDILIKAYCDELSRTSLEPNEAIIDHLEIALAERNARRNA